MNQHTDEPRFATVTAEGVDYPIYLTSPDRDYIQKNLATKGIPYELPMLTDMKSRLSADSTVLDIGANIGNHTFYLAQVLRCQVIAFEANDELAHAMDLTTSEAGLEERVTVHAFALGEKPGFAEFEQAIPENLGGQSLRKGSGRIKVRTLDSFGISAPIAAIKIDVEGMELDVLKGGKKVIESNLPMLYVESQTKENFAEISSYLKTLGYCYRNTFNATPTHLFIHKTKLKVDDHATLPALNRVEREYDLLAVNQKVKKDLVDCQMKYREICQLNNNLRSENERLQIQLTKVESSDADIVRMQSQLDQAQQKLTDTDQLIARLKAEVASERSEKEFQVQQFLQKNRTDRMGAALQEKLTAEVERLTAENRSQSALLDGHQAMKFALEDSKKKCAEMSFILENAKSEVVQEQAEKSKLLTKIKEMEDENAQLLRLKEQLDGMQDKHQHLQVELEKQVALVATHDQKSKEQMLQLQSQAQQLAAMEKQKAEIDALKIQLQQLTVDNARLNSENVHHASVVEALAGESAKIEKLEQSLLEYQNELAQYQEENTRLNTAVDELKQTLINAQEEVLKVNELEQRQEEYQSKVDQANKEMARLTLELESASKDVARIPDLERAIEDLEQQRAEHVNAIESLKVQHEQYVQGRRALYEQQQRENEQQMHIMIQRKMESLAPLQANQERLDKLVEYRNDIEKIYSEHNPLLNDVQGNQEIEQILQKKEALSALSQHLTEFNNRSRS